MIGVNKLTISVWDISLEVNQARDSTPAALPNPPKLDWAAFFAKSVGLVPTNIPDVAATVDVSAVGSIAIDVDGFVQVYGSFAFSKQSGIPVGR